MARGFESSRRYQRKKEKKKDRTEGSKREIEKGRERRIMIIEIRDQGEKTPYLKQKKEDDPLIILVLLDQWMRSMPMNPFAFTVGDARIRYSLSKTQVEGMYHTVSRVKPTESLEHDLVDGTGSLAVYRRSGNALAG